MLPITNIVLKQMFSFSKGPSNFIKSTLFKNNKFSFRPGPIFTTKNHSNVNHTQDIKTQNVSNVGLQKYLMRVYNTTGLSIGGALLAAALGTAMPFCAIHPVATSIGGMLASLACFIGVQFTTPNTITEYIPGTSTPIYKTQNPLHRILMYSLGIATLGISTSPLFSFILATNPSIITASLGLTMGIFGGASLMAYRLPANKVLGYGRILMGSLIGLIGIQILGVASMAIVGPNALSMLLFNVQNYLGVALFTALIGYDTHVAMAEYRSGIADHLRLSVQLVLDFWNLMVRIMSIMSMFRE